MAAAVLVCATKYSDIFSFDLFSIVYRLEYSGGPLCKRSFVAPYRGSPGQDCHTFCILYDESTC